MVALHGLPLLLQAGVPVVLLVWQARAANRSVIHWLTRVILISCYLLAVHVVGLWLVLPWYTALIAFAVLMVVALRQLRHVRTLPWTSPMRWPAIVGRTALALCALAMLGAVVVSRRPPPTTVVDLEFPLRDGVYYVASGGSTRLFNTHLMTLVGERFRAFRGQSYGIDLVKIGPFGLRASGLLPADPARYAIFGDPVFAPCAGSVVHAEDGAADMSPPQPDRTRIAGNHVLLDCGGVHVLLGHLKQGSVRVAQHDRVTTDTVLGLVGNSGNSNEPHLHIHAQRPAVSGGEPLSGDPLPIRLSGRYLVRNDRAAATKSGLP